MFPELRGKVLKKNMQLFTTNILNVWKYLQMKETKGFLVYEVRFYLDPNLQDHTIIQEYSLI